MVLEGLILDEFLFFGVIALVLIVFIFVVPIVALTKIGNLRWELNQVKKELDKVLEGLNGEEQPESKQPAKVKTPKATAKKVAKTPIKVAAKAAKAAPVVAKEPEKPKGPNFIQRIFQNIQQNWIVWIAGVSLAFGGVFIVQFGIENGLLGPKARVALAIAFGLALIAGAEYLRKRSKGQKVALFSPVAALAAGGIASLFGAVVSAHVLYGLTSAMVGFVSMAVVAWVAMALAMIYGPILAVIGILGAYFSPFLVSSDSGAEMMYLYYLLVLAASLFVERWQKWIWLSSLSVGCALFLGWAMHMDMTRLAMSGPYYAAVAILAMTIPAFGFLPKSNETAMVDQHSIQKISFQYPTVLAVGTGVAVTVLMFFYAGADLIHWQIGALAMLALAAFAIFLCRRAQNLDQLAAIYSLGAIAIIGQVAWALFTYSQGITVVAERSVVPYFPIAGLVMLGLLVLGVGGSLWRAGHSVRPTYWHIMTAVLPLVGFGAFYVGWEHSLVRGPAFWNGASVGLAVYLTALTGIMLKRGQTAAADILGTGAVAGWTMAALITMDYRDPWLTVALGVLVGLVHLVYVRFGLRWVATAGVVVTGLVISRLVLEPGWLWATNALLMPVIIAFGGALAIFIACLRDATDRKLATQVVQFETASLAGLATLFCVFLVRWATDIPDYTIAGIYAALLGVLAMVQLYRCDALLEFKKFRNVLGRVLSIGAGLMLGAAVLVFSPLNIGIVSGFFPIDSIMLAYGLPLALLAASVYFDKVPYLIPKVATLGGIVGLGAYMLVLEIRHIWHGTNINLYKGVYQNELYTYTFVMLFATVLVFIASVRKNSILLRRIGLALAALTAVKVFLWDISELRGLGRATSFIGLGLTFAALGWVHQAYAIKSDKKESE